MTDTGSKDNLISEFDIAQVFVEQQSNIVNEVNAHINDEAEKPETLLNDKLRQRQVSDNWR